MTTDDPIESDGVRAARLRAMNELIRARRNEFEGQDVSVHSIMCECVDPACSEMLQVSDDDLQVARSNPEWFVVEPTHVGGAVLVTQANSHCIVRFPTA